MYDWLLSEIENFIKKYYFNKIIKGILIIIGILLCYGLLLIISEYFLYLSAVIKKTIFYFSLTAIIVAISIWIIYPVLQLFKLGKRLNKNQAAIIIGNHFPNIEDKLLNILELKDNIDQHSSKELVLASIDQKSKELSSYRFVQGIQIRNNKKLLPIIIIPIINFFTIFAINKNIIQESSNRLLDINTTYLKPAPFDFIIHNDALLVESNEDITIKASLKGKQIPKELFILLNNEKITMIEDGDNEYSFTLKNITKNTIFKLEAAGYQSQDYEITLSHKAKILASEIVLHYPSYINKEKETIIGLTNLSIPEGTKIIWKNNAINSNDIFISFDNNIKKFINIGNNTYTFDSTFFESTSYQIINNQEPHSEKYDITIIKDQAPIINIEQTTDKINKELVLLTGIVSDDYGIANIKFITRVIGNNGNTITQKATLQAIDAKTSSTINIYIDINTYQLQLGQKLQYYIEVIDNKPYNGGNITRSQIFEYKTINPIDANKEMQSMNQQMNQSIAAGKEKMKELDKQLQELQESALQKDKLSNWEKDQQLQLLKDQQNNFKEKLEEIANKLEQQKKLVDEKNVNDNIKDKQDAVKKQVENLLNKELQEKLDKLNELLDQKNKDVSVEEFKSLQQENKLYNMDLERIESLIKQIEKQMQLEEIANKLDHLSEQQDNLNNKTSKDNTDNNKTLSKEQQNLKQQLDKLIKEEIEPLSQEDDKLSDEANDANDASEEMQESSQNLDKKQNTSSKKNQDNAAKKMKSLSKKMQDMAGGMDAEQIDIDIKATRQLLTNLLRLSFQQEEIINRLQKTRRNSDAIPTIIQEQAAIQKSSTLIKDSLFALSKRIEKLSPTINKESIELEHRLQQTITLLEDRNISTSMVQQQYVMTSANNLALVLNNLLSNLLSSQASGDGQGQGSSKGNSKGQSSGGSQSGKQGKGAGSGSGSAGDQMKDIITGQQKLGESLKKMSGKGNNGDKANGQNNQGESSNNGQNGNNNGNGNGNGNNSGNYESQNNQSKIDAETLSKVAYEQAKLRQQIQELNNVLNTDGIKGNSGLMKEIQDNMDKIETQLINRRIDDQLIRQQSEIMSRLLKVENSIREQEQDDKRQGKVGLEKPRPIPPTLQNKINEINYIKEKYKTTPPQLNNKYININRKYLNI